MGLESSQKNYFVNNHCFGLFSIVWNYGGLIMPYIKDEDKWHKDDNKVKIKNVIHKVSNKNITFLTENPLNNIDVQKLKIDGSFNNILLETFNFSDTKFDQNDNIIKNISKNVLIEKNM